METIAKVPVCKPIPVSEADYHNIEEPCVFQESEGKWQELQQFWDKEKHRLQDFESQTQQLSSSLERSLLFDECVEEPRDEVETEYKDEVACVDDQTNVVVHGDEINDIPTQYIATGFKPNELIVIGTYVDKRIVPGFKYKVRKNLTEKYLFGGKALRLDQVGQGYGKRLTFQSPFLNKNPNIFWSDSCAAGFGFTLQAVSPGDVFAVHEPACGRYLGQATVTDLKEDQVEESTVWGPNGRVVKLVRVSFLCNIVLGDQDSQKALNLNDISASGLVRIVKKNQSARAEVESIELTNFVGKDCTLTPEN